MRRPEAGGVCTARIRRVLSISSSSAAASTASGIARDAAGRGLKVLLVEQDDLAAATSSASTKLIHGGLRYLETYEFRLVREVARSSASGCWPLRRISSGRSASSCRTTR